MRRGQLTLASLGAALVLTACSGRSGDVASGDPDATAPVACATQRTAQSGTLVVQAIIPDGESCESGTIELSVSGPNGVVKDLSLPRTGYLVDLWIVDLMDDLRIDAVAVTRSPGPERKADVHVIENLGAGALPRTIAAPRSRHLVGYRGFDEFYVRGGSLVRSFPVFRDDDVPPAATGGHRALRYSFVSGAWEDLPEDGFETDIVRPPERESAP